MNSAQQTITSIQDKQIRQELSAIAKHGKNIAGKSVIFAARTRSQKALMSLGLTMRQAKDAVTDAADMVALEVAAQ